MRYRRYRAAGATWFFTVVTHDRRPFLARPRNVMLLRAAFGLVMARHPFVIDAAVIMPDHLHAVWTLPPGDEDFSLRWRLIKSAFSRRSGPECKGAATPSRTARRQQAVWQHRFWEHRIRDDADFARHVAYIHYNPVKHGLVGAPIDWPYSSFHRYVRAGKFAPDWGSTEMVFDADVGGE